MPAMFNESKIESKKDMRHARPMPMQDMIRKAKKINTNRLNRAKWRGFDIFFTLGKRILEKMLEKLECQYSNFQYDGVSILQFSVCNLNFCLFVYRKS